MLSVELKVNGVMVGHIYARNITSTEKLVGLNLYHCEYYRPETRKVSKGKVSHNREDGIEILVGKILTLVGKTL